MPVSNVAIVSPTMGIIVLVIFVLAGKLFRDNWKAQGPHWKRNCWFAGIVAALCFLALAFVPFVPR
nr:hypothetical protein [uncultured Cohaesibacter sp.]